MHLPHPLHRILAGVAALALTACGASEPRHAAGDSAHSAIRRDSATADSLVAPKVALVARPTPLRGLYVSRWAALGDRMWQLIGVAKTTEINALVIDVKDDRGFVLYRSRVPLAREIGADTADGHWMSSSKLRAVLDTMAAHKIYPIARIVVAKDPLL